MKCRNLVETGSRNIVWFGSCGKIDGFDVLSFDFETPSAPGNIYNAVSKADGIFKQPIPYDPDLIDVALTLLWNGENISPEFGEAGLIENKSHYDPQSSTPTDVSFAFYYYEDSTISEIGRSNILTIVREKPADWKQNYRKYKVGEAKCLHNPVFWAYGSEPMPTYLMDVTGRKLPAQNYAFDGEAVKMSLIQRLSVIKGELWYKASYGLPLTDKIKNKNIYDSIVVDIITSHSGIANLIEYESYIENRQYRFKFKAMTIFNEELSISYSI